MTGRELLLFPQLPNGVNDNSNNDNDGGTNAESREFASMLDSRLAAAAYLQVIEQRRRRRRLLGMLVIKHG